MSNVEQQQDLAPPASTEQEDRVSFEAEETNFDLDFKSLTELVLNHTATFNYKLSTPGGEQLFFAGTTPFKSKSSMLLHEGTDKGPVLATARFHLIRGDDEIAVGDPNSDSSLQWTPLSRHGLFTKVPRSFSIPNDPNRKFVWKGTRNLPDLPGLEDVKMSKMTLFHMKLVEEASGEVMAVYVSQPIGNVGSRGSLYFKNGQSKDWELLTIISALTIMEKRKRARMSSGGAHV